MTTGPGAAEAGEGAARTVDRHGNHVREDILGIRVSAIDMEMALRITDAWIAEGVSRYVCVTGVHGVMESRRDPELQRIHNDAGMVTPDGMPLVWLTRRAGHPHVDRVYGPDLMLALCDHSQGVGHRHFFYGGGPGTPERLVARLRERFPRLQVAGTHSPPFRELTPEEDEEVVALIAASRADVIWVGLGTPRQERWMAAHVGRFPGVMFGVGAAFDFHSGAKKQAPRWMQRRGLEWFFRLVTEPRRLWRRYLATNTSFLMLLARNWWTSRRR